MRDYKPVIEPPALEEEPDPNAELPVPECGDYYVIDPALAYHRADGIIGSKAKHAALAWWYENTKDIVRARLYQAYREYRRLNASDADAAARADQRYLDHINQAAIHKFHAETAAGRENREKVLSSAGQTRTRATLEEYRLTKPLP